MKEPKIKTIFETSDGKQFTDEALAKNHQKELNTYNENSKKVYTFFVRNTKIYFSTLPVIFLIL